MTDIPMRIVMSVAGGNAIAGAFGQIASSLGPAGVVGAALLGFGISSVKVSADFQNAMLQNEAHAGLAASQVQNVNRALLQMGPAVGQGPTQLAEALYPILSGFSGISNQAAKTQVSLTELKLAAQSVAGSTTSVTTVSNAATASFNALGLATNNSATNIQRMNWLFDVMNTTVSSGNMHWQDYANVAGKLATAIKGTGVSFVEANAALATMTNEGFSAQRSQTYLANLFTQLDLKTDAMAKHAAKLGVAFDEQKFKTMSLAQQVDYLNKITHGNQSELLALLGGNATALKTFNALESGMKSYKNNLDALNHSHGATAQAFAVASQGYNFALARLGASFQSLQISVGNIFLPMLTALVNAMVPVVAGLASWIAANNQITLSITNASTGMLPAIRHLRDMAMDLYQVLSYRLNASMPTLRQEFLLTANVAQTQFLPALQGTSNWMISTGTPTYTAFAKVVHDLLSGSFRQAGQDAIHMGIDISQSISGLPAKFAALKMPKLKLDIAIPDLKVGSSLGNLGMLLSPILFLPANWGPVLAWLQGVFGPGWKSAFDNVMAPPVQAFRQILHDLMPDFLQFAQFWQTTIAPMFHNVKAPDTSNWLIQFGQIWKDLWQSMIPAFETGIRWSLWMTELFLPAILKVGGFILWLGEMLVGPLLKGIDLAIVGFGDFASWINNGVMPVFQAFLELIPQFGQWLQDLGAQLGGYGAQIGAVFADLWAHLWKGEVDSLTNMTKFWKFTFDGFKTVLGGLGGFAASVWGGLAGGMRMAFNQIIDIINGMISRIDSIQIAGWGVHIALLPHLASGGTLTRGGLALVGERGPEVVALPGGSTVYPNGTGPAGMGGGVTYIFYLSLSTMARSQSEVQRLVDMIEQEIGNRVLGQTPSYASGGIF